MGAIKYLLLTMVTLALQSCAGGAPTSGSAPRQESRLLDRGQRQFRSSCAACHGEDSRGRDPVASVLSVPVPDLTLIASRRGSHFPANEIFRIVDGQADLRAHGPRHMPVWGHEFFGDDAEDEAAHRKAVEKIDLVVDYLRSIQRTPGMHPE